jgi:hypothetical protein
MTITDPNIWLTVSAASLLGLVIATQAALRGWRDWLDVRRLEIEGRRDTALPPSSASRIEIADLKERVRKLEAIAAGVEL